MTTECLQGNKQNDAFDKYMLGDVAMNIMIIKTNTDDMDEHKYDGHN